MARRIWLAGIGAYGSAFNEAQESLSKMGAETSRVFDELVAKGEQIEKTVEDRGKEVVSKVKATPSFSLDDRLEQMRQRLGMISEQIDTSAVRKVAKPVVTEKPDIEARLDVIEAKLDQILSQLEPAAKPKKKAPAKKRVSRKSTKK